MTINKITTRYAGIVPIASVKRYSLRMGGILAGCLAVALMSTDTRANFFYNYIESPSGEVLATLELTSLPVTALSEVAGLTFTTAGEVRFGYSSPYLGGFTSLQGTITDDGIGGLAGNSRLSDGTPPNSSHHPNSGTIEFWLDFSPAPLVDGSTLTPGFPSDPFVHIDGNWRLVPEPSSLVLLGLGGITLLTRCRRREVSRT